MLELCEKGELFDLLYRGGPVPAVVCKEYFRQLMSGIKFCHGMYVLACVCVCLDRCRQQAVDYGLWLWHHVLPWHACV